MFVVKLFRNGTRDPDQVEFYSTDSPVVKRVEDATFPDVEHQIEICVDNRSEMIDIYHGDQVFIENAQGVTIHSIR